MIRENLSENNVKEKTQSLKEYTQELNFIVKKQKIINAFIKKLIGYRKELSLYMLISLKF